MPQKLSSILIKATSVLLGVLTLEIGAPASPKFRVLYNFRDGSDGAYPVPFAALAIDKGGNLYGATQAGGDIKNNYCEGYGCGVIFELSPSGDGRWKEGVLFEITNPVAEGEFDSQLALDAQGDLYGCTENYGPMFEMTPRSPQWTFNPIWPGGCIGPVGLILDSLGDLYGEFGKGSTGGISELSPSSDGWAYTNLYEFCPSGQNCRDGDDPLAPLSWDSKGNLYGTTYDGGYPYPKCSCGVAFQMTPNGDGTWTYHVLHRFTFGNDGGHPGSGLTLDASGNAYGTAIYGGPYGNGDVFKLAPTKSGPWKLTVLYGFPNGTNGAAPVGNLVFDKAGNLYGIAGSSTCNWTCGLVFKLAPQKNGKWKCSVVHRFNMKNSCPEPEFTDRFCNPAGVIQLFPNPLEEFRSGRYAKSRRHDGRRLSQRPDHGQPRSSLRHHPCRRQVQIWRRLRNHPIAKVCRALASGQAENAPSHCCTRRL